MSIDITFRFLKIIVNRKADKRKEIPLSENVREEAAGVDYI